MEHFPNFIALSYSPTVLVSERWKSGESAMKYIRVHDKSDSPIGEEFFLSLSFLLFYLVWIHLVNMYETQIWRLILQFKSDFSKWSFLFAGETYLRILLLS